MKNFHIHLEIITTYDAIHSNYIPTQFCVLIPIMEQDIAMLHQIFMACELTVLLLFFS